ncbi:hypothetical protein Gogos_008304, partial [Gossypium gossypioides]|nr:hypothetical protein [Gossypium gossypioides]
ALPSTEAICNKLLQLPRIPSLLKFARRDQYAEMEERKWPAGVLGTQDCISEIDSTGLLISLLLRSLGESLAMDSSIFTKAWVDTAGSGGIKGYHAIKRWQSQAAAADPDFFHRTVHVKDEEESNTSSRQLTWKHDERANENSISQVAVSKERFKNDPRGADHIKHAVVVYVGSLLMPLYKARKIDKDGNKSIMKKTATKYYLVANISFWNSRLENIVVLGNGQREITDRMFRRYGSRLGATGWCSVEGGNEARAGDEVDIPKLIQRLNLITFPMDMRMSSGLASGLVGFSAARKHVSDTYSQIR